MEWVRYRYPISAGEIPKDCNPGNRRLPGAPIPVSKGYGYHSYLPGRCSWKKEYRLEATNFPSIHRLHPGKSFSASNAHQHYPESKWPALLQLQGLYATACYTDTIHTYIFICLFLCPAAATAISNAADTTTRHVHVLFFIGTEFLSINIEVRTT